MRKKYIVIIGVLLLLLCINFAIRQLQTEKIKQLTHDLSSNNNDIRGRAIDALEELGARAVPALLNILKDAQGQAKIDIIQLLGKNSSRNVALELTKMLKDNNWKVRFFTAEALGKIGDKYAVNPLLETWEDEKIWQVSQQIAIALNKIGYDENEEILFLTNIFNNSKDLYNQILSAILLYEITEKDIYKNFIIQEILEEDITIKSQVFFTLKSMKAPKTFSLLDKSFNDFDNKTQDLILRFKQ
jgi:HEAT repeat protein